MTVVIFTGSTLDKEEVIGVLPEADVRPPAAFGDLYLAAREHPFAIGLIDGLFLRTPSVWHKEILWAMHHGVHVLGAASMGALRAAELEPFGMEGVGEIFRAFRDGDLEDDDEVTIAHAGADEAWRPLSQAMVDIRATLRAALAADVIDEQTATALTAVGKQLPYPERALERILRDARHRNLSSHEHLESLRAWLVQNRVHQKRADALALLARMVQLVDLAPGPKHVDFPFEPTDAWEDGRRRAEERQTVDEFSGREALLEELRLEGIFPQTRDGALLRGRALEDARRRGVPVDDTAVLQTIELFRCERELRDADAFERWLNEEGLRGPEGTRFFREETLARLGRLAFARDIKYIDDHLRATGDRLHFVERARKKRELLATQGVDNLASADTDPSEPELWRWFFEKRLGRVVPKDVRAWAVSQGFDDDQALHSAALREYRFLRLSGQRSH